MATQIQLRRGTAASATSANPTLAPGEIGFETDTGFYKIGDGATAWNSLLYAGGPMSAFFLTLLNDANAAALLTTLGVTAAAQTLLGLSNVVGVRSLTVALTDAQIKALPTTGITVIPAFGAGFVAVPIGPPQIVINAAAGVYTGIDGSAELRLEYASGGGQFMNPILESAGKVTDIFGTASENFGMWVTPTSDFADALTNYENDSVQVIIDNGGGAGSFGGGHASNSGSVTIDYRLRAV